MATGYCKPVNYYEALRAAASVRIDFLIADVSLPGPNGCELAVQLLRSESELQVLFISGYTGAEVCSTYGVSLSGSHFLAKPF
ncbi:MAG: response regulator [Bryobacteraceae bacterium]